MIKQRIFLLCALLSVAFSSVATTNDNTTSDVPPADSLKLYQASYKLFRQGNELGEGYRELSATQSGYSLKAHSKIQWMFLSDSRKERSDFSIVDGIFTPKQYHFVRTGTGRDREESIDFLGEKIETVYKSNQKTIRPIQLTFDPLLYQLALRQDLIDGKELLSYHMVRRGKQTHYQFERVGKETVNVPYGRVEAIKIKRIRKKSSRETFIWVAPSLNYSVVKLVQHKDGSEQAQMQLNWIKFDNGK
ncbi:DUF3108 domain-containing protein [Psychrobium sp. 1_MG-2023]|uniref:DUF3108 domain-containing protein n=1 Tax=Psychrobium sp. 1_MG-2023 TaxID=3062624 RepID=UPI000C34671A|nr:DUF3108 domain-containing protein [Psychrobium sp. 1_MG-2023]MDP2560128.1 DUF3108 domain-containing protein [Psychrobium sp. 1_MG-2023]PKF56941.1 DUF3108 domain-containing protein [Alteromonadales bacterium alter-6D02]